MEGCVLRPGPASEERGGTVGPGANDDEMMSLGGEPWEGPSSE